MLSETDSLVVPESNTWVSDASCGASPFTKAFCVFFNCSFSWRVSSSSAARAPIESDSEGEEGNDCQRLKIVAWRELITLYKTTHRKVAIQTD